MGTPNLDKWKIKIINGPQEGKFFPLTPGSTLGRKKATHVLDEPKASSVHAVIKKTGSGKMILSDNNSRNGTRVNGQRQDKIVLAPGVKFQIGNTYFEVIDFDDYIRSHIQKNELTSLLDGEGELDIFGGKPSESEEFTFRKDSVPTPPKEDLDLSESSEVVAPPQKTNEKPESPKKNEQASAIFASEIETVNIEVQNPPTTTTQNPSFDFGANQVTDPIITTARPSPSLEKPIEENPESLEKTAHKPFEDLDLGLDEPEEVPIEAPAVEDINPLSPFANMQAPDGTAVVVPDGLNLSENEVEVPDIGKVLDENEGGHPPVSLKIEKAKSPPPEKAKKKIPAAKEEELVIEHHHQILRPNSKDKSKKKLSAKKKEAITPAISHPTEQKDAKPKPATDSWQKTLDKALKNLEKKAKDDLSPISPFQPGLTLRIASGPQASTLWELGYGPRSVGPHSHEFTIFDVDAPPICFTLFPGEKGAMFQTRHPDKVLLNQKPTGSALIKDGDIISFSNTIIEVGTF